MTTPTPPPPEREEHHPDEPETGQQQALTVPDWFERFLQLSSGNPETVGDALVSFGFSKGTAATSPPTRPTNDKKPPFDPDEITNIRTTIAAAKLYTDIVAPLPATSTELWMRRVPLPTDMPRILNWSQVLFIQELIGPQLSLSYETPLQGTIINGAPEMIPTNPQPGETQRANPDVIRDNRRYARELDYGTVTGSVLYNPRVQGHSGIDGLVTFAKEATEGLYVKRYNPITHTDSGGQVHPLSFGGLTDPILECVFQGYISRMRMVDRIRQPKRLEFEITLSKPPYFYQTPAVP